MEVLGAILVIGLALAGFVFLINDAKEYGCLAAILEVVAVIILAAFGL